MAVRGVLSSWLMLARNSDVARAADFRAVSLQTQRGLRCPTRGDVGVGSHKSRVCGRNGSDLEHGAVGAFPLVDGVPTLVDVSHDLHILLVAGKFADAALILQYLVLVRAGYRQIRGAVRASPAHVHS